MGTSACLPAGIGSIHTSPAHSHMHNAALGVELRSRLQGFATQLYSCFSLLPLGSGLFEIKLNSFKIYLKEKTLINYALIDLKMFNLP